MLSKYGNSGQYYFILKISIINFAFHEVDSALHKRLCSKKNSTFVSKLKGGNFFYYFLLNLNVFYDLMHPF